MASHQADPASNIDRVTGWWVFAGILLFISGTLNVIYGIAAIADSKFFTENATYILSDLNTWGWVTLILGCLQIGAGGSLFAGNEYYLLVDSSRPALRRSRRYSRSPRIRSGRPRSLRSRSSWCIHSRRRTETA